MRSLNAFLILPILHFYGVYGALTDDVAPCKTPNEQAGECVSIRSCPALYMLLTPKPIPIENSNFLKRSHCGFIGHVPKVCCPTGEISARDKANLPDDDDLPQTIPKFLPSTRICGTDIGKKIFGGEAADLDEFPWMALLVYQLPKGTRDYKCGGALISDRYVLTAAHCLKGKYLPKYWKLTDVRLGEFNKDSDNDCVLFKGTNKKWCLPTPPINVTIEEEIIHENYDPEDDDQKNDIALLRLAEKVKFTDFIKPICLPILDDEIKKTYTGLNLTVAGWGQTENKSSSSIKLKLLVPVMSPAHCKSLYSDASKEVSEKQICAGGLKNKDSCQGDSGGPLMSISLDENGDSNWYLAGIVSYGPVDPCGVENWPGVYTRVSKYMGWILRHMKS